VLVVKDVMGAVCLVLGQNTLSSRTDGARQFHENEAAQPKAARAAKNQAKK
jgi:hypothetical protein